MEMATRRREQEVWQACDDLFALGGEVHEITGDAIRERLLHLGKSRGSPNELYKYRKTWIKSRGLETSSSMPAMNGDDPISRAVRLVHEQLKNESAFHIASLQEKFEKKLLEKDQELENKSNALEAVMAEFSEREKRLFELGSQIQTLEAEKHAEIEVRKATEKEAAIITAKRDAEKAAHDSLINEIKTIHQRELAQIQAQYQEIEATQRTMLENLQEEKKQLGFEYSEKLNELRTIMYNQDIKLKEINNSFTNAQITIKKLADELLDKNRTIETKTQTVLLKDAEIGFLQGREKRLSSELKQALTQKKRAEITIARLRALIQAQG